MRFPSRRESVQVLIVGNACVCLMGLDLAVSYYSLTPPASARRIEDFRRLVPNPRAIVRIHKDSKAFYVIFGRQAIEVMAERPSGYLFNADGELLNWAHESNSSDTLGAYWELGRVEIDNGRVLGYDDLTL